MTDRIVTPRLTLRRITMDDVPAMHAIFADAEVMQYWSRLPHTDIAETESWVAKNIAAVESGEADDFVVLHDGVADRPRRHLAEQRTRRDFCP